MVSDIALKKRPVSLTIICVLCLVVILLTILLFVRLYNQNQYASEHDQQWYIFMILIQLPIIAGVVLMYFLKKIGLWLFLLGKVLLFVLPFIAGSDIMGLMTPIFFIESATFFILFGKRIQFMH